MSNGIEELQQHRENQEKKHATRMDELNRKEKLLTEKQKGLEIKEKEFEQHNGQLLAENRQKDELLHKLWKQDCEKRKESRDKYLNSIVEKEKKKARKGRRRALIILGAFILGILGVYFFIPEGKLNVVDAFLSNKLISIVISISTALILCGWNYFTWQNYHNWHNNPSFEKSKKDTTPIPKDLRDLTFEDFINSIK